MTWSLKTSDGRTTESIPFRVEYNIELPPDPEPRMLRTIEVSIPVRGRTVDSLNAATAASILLFEAVRQRG